MPLLAEEKVARKVWGWVTGPHDLKENIMNGWKTWAGAALIAIGTGLSFAGYNEIGEAIKNMGIALTAIGVGHKIEKAAR